MSGNEMIQSSVKTLWRDPSWFVCFFLHYMQRRIIKRFFGRCTDCRGRY